jgi:dTMP kinase
MTGPVRWTKAQPAAHLSSVPRGRFITLEGGEGAGKSTQARRLAARLRQRGLEVATTREPGGSPGAETIRELLVTGGADRWSATTETLLMYAARRDHIERTIAPALATGSWVISDRFADSTRAYQGAGGGVPASFIQALERYVLGELRPDLTLILDLPVEAGMARVAERTHAETRFEAKGEAFHQRLREGFLAIARVEADRCSVIDASAPLDDVEAAIWAAVEARLAP